MPHQFKTVTAQSRKSFFKTLGTLGLSGIISSNALANSVSTYNALNESKVRKKRLLRIAHLTDIHVQPDKVAEYGMASALEAVNKMSDKPDVIINGGDAIMNAVAFDKQKVKAQWNSFHTVLKHHNSLPVHHTIGNHDLFGWALPGNNDEEGKKWAMDEYQLLRPYYHIRQNGWNIIVLDSIHTRKSLPGYYGKLDTQQLQWLKNTLLAIPGHEPVCVVSHIPILAVCSLFDTAYVDKNNWFVPDNILHHDARELRDLFYQSKNVKVCLSGHIHLIDHVNYLGTDYYCNGAVSGGWWKGNHQEFAPSYIIINLYDDGSNDREIHYYNWNKNS